MRKYKLDYEKSKKMFEEFSYMVKQKNCYSNIAQLVLNHITYEEELSNIKIAFGAWDCIDNLVAKHCFFLLDDKVIDPTFFTLRNVEKEKEYYMFISFDLDEYLNALDINMGDTCLPKHTINVFETAFNELRRENIILIG